LKTQASTQDGDPPHRSHFTGIVPGEPGSIAPYEHALTHFPHFRQIFSLMFQAPLPGFLSMALTGHALRQSGFSHCLQKTLWPLPICLAGLSEAVRKRSGNSNSLYRVQVLQ
jgi:hypothetical protein